MVNNVSALFPRGKSKTSKKKIADTFRKESEKEEIKRFQLILPLSWHKKLKITAAKQGTTVSDMIRDAVQEKYGL